MFCKCILNLQMYAQGTDWGLSCCIRKRKQQLHILMILPYNEWILGTTKLRNLGLSEGTLSSEKVHIRELYLLFSI